MHHPQIYVDMDGVLADFVHGICKAHNRPNPYSDPSNHGNFSIDSIWGMSPALFWKPANAEFWRNLSVTDIYTDIVDVLTPFQLDLCVLSSPSKTEGCIAAKEAWLREYFDAPSFFGKEKWRLAAPNKLLIDDYDKNVDHFRSKGGVAYLIPRPWNKRHNEEFDVNELKDVVHEFYEGNYHG